MIQTDNAALHELLIEISGKLDQLLARGQHATPAIPNIAEHLRVIAAKTTNTVFTTSELVVHSANPENTSLCAALIGMAGSVNARKIGKVLRNVEGMEIGGLRVERVAQERDGIVWIVRVCKPAETRTQPFAAQQ
jgi:hypothetical protein